MGPLQNLKVGPQGLPLKFKSGTPSPFFNEFIFFSEYFISFLLYYFLSFLNKMQKNSNCEWQKSILSTKDKKVHMTRKHLSAETEQKPHWSNNILESPSFSNPSWNTSVRCHSYTEVTKRNVHWTCIGGWVFKLYGRLCVWQFERNENLFNITFLLHYSTHFICLPFSSLWTQ